MRGSPAAFERLSKKDGDTLYFIYENEIDEGKLYLGDRLIAGGDIGRTSIDALKDVVITEGLADKSLLVYDLKQKLWVNKSFNEVINVFVPPTSQSNGVAGLVPVPPRGKRDLFLRSDGQWVDTEFAGTSLDINENVFAYDENGKLNLYGFFGADAGAQLIKGADGKLCWVESDLSILNDLKNAVTALQQTVNKLTSILPIERVDGTLMFDMPTKTLSVNKITSTHITDLDTLLQQKANKDTVTALQQEVHKLVSILPIEKIDGTLMFDVATKTLSVNKITSTHITDLSALLEKKADKDAISELRLDIDALGERLTWDRLN